MICVNIKKEFNCKIEKIWDIVTNNNDYSWRSDLSKIEIIDGNNFIEYDKNNYPTSFVITKKDYLKEYCFDIKNSNMEGSWTGCFNKLENGLVCISFTENIDVKNVVMRLFAKIFIKNQQKRYIDDLVKKLES